MNRSGRFSGMSQGIALVSAIALVAISIGISAGGRDVQAAGSSVGSVSGEGAIDVAGVTTTVYVSAADDGVSPPTGSFWITTNPTNGPRASVGPESVTCLFIQGSTAVVGGFVGGTAYLVFVTDGGSGGASDTMEVLSPAGIPDCATPGPTGPTTLSSGSFTVTLSRPTGTPPPSRSPAPSDVAPADGISDSLQPSGTAAGSFIDDSTTPTTYGSIVSTGGLSVAITDAPFPDGVAVTVGAEVPGAQAELSACGSTVLIDAGSVITITCHSVIVKVTTGLATIVLGGGTTFVSIPPGGAAEVTDTGAGSFSVANLGIVTVSLTVDGTTAEIPAGAPPVTAETWDFVGFARPIDNIPTVNRVKAGQAIPIKWRLLDEAGAPITNLSSASLTVTTLDCALGATIDQAKEAVAGSSGLQNLGRGYYQLNWKSPKAYARSCKTLHLNINDGVTHDALFQFAN